MPTVHFVHVAFAAEPDRVMEVRKALYAIVTSFDFAPAFELDRAWSNRWWGDHFGRQAPIDQDSLQALHQRWSDVVEVETSERPGALPAPPERCSKVHLERFYRAAQSLLDYVDMPMPDDFDVDPELWPMIRGWGVSARVDRAREALEVIAGDRPAFEPRTFDAHPEFSELNPIHLFDLTGDLVMYCCAPDDTSIGVGRFHSLADDDPYTPGVPTPEELAHSSQPRRAIDHWTEEELWRPPGLALELLVDDGWPRCPDFDRVYARPLASGLMRGPVSFGVGATLEEGLHEEFIEKCRPSREAGRAVVGWVEVVTD